MNKVIYSMQFDLVPSQEKDRILYIIRQLEGVLGMGFVNIDPVMYMIWGQTFGITEENALETCEGMMATRENVYSVCLPARLNFSYSIYSDFELVVQDRSPGSNYATDSKEVIHTLNLGFDLQKSVLKNDCFEAKEK